MSRPHYLPPRNLELLRPLTLDEERAYSRARAILRRKCDRWRAVLRRIEEKFFKGWV